MTREACNWLRDRLLAEHLDSTPQEVGKVLKETGSLLKTILAVHGKERIVRPLEGSPTMIAILTEPLIVDPERPISAEKFMERFVGEEIGHLSRKKITGFAILVLFLIVLAGLWRFSPMSSYLDADLMIHKIQALQEYRTAPLIILAMFVLGGLVVFPVLILIAMTSILFDPLSAFGLAMAGSLMSGAFMYWIGHALGGNFIRHVAGKRINRLSKSLARQGLLTIIILRIVPVAPYSIVNLLAGASHIMFRDFLIGTAIGMFPGIFAITLFTESLKHFILEPTPTNIAILAGSVILAAALIVWLSRITRRVSRKSLGERSP